MYFLKRTGGNYNSTRINIFGVQKVGDDLRWRFRQDYKPRVSMDFAKMLKDVKWDI